MTKILIENFGMEVVTPRVKVRKAGRSLELDVLAYANSECNAAYIVEIKSHLRPDGIEQLQNILKQFRTDRRNYVVKGQVANPFLTIHGFFSP